jgi:hypothetical protein
MRKSLLILIIVVLLAGCSVNMLDTKIQIGVSLDDAALTELTMNQNLRKATFDYFLPPDVGRKESSQSSTVLVSHNVNILMNLDIVSVLGDRFYKTEGMELLRAFILAAPPIYKKSDATIGLDQKSLPYDVKVIQIKGNIVLVTLQTRYFLFSAIAPFVLTPDILYDMLLIARTCRVNVDEVVLRYANRETINYQKETLEIFSQLAPDSGKVIDMISVDTGQNGLEK